MRKTCIIIFLLISSPGCLSFGEDVLTENPTVEQLEYCRATLHIRDGIEIEPLGLKVLGSGIDDAVWFKFAVKETDPGLIFDPEAVPADSLGDPVSFFDPQDMPDWWDGGEYHLTGGTVSTGIGEYLRVAFRREGDSLILYVFWNES